MRALVMLYPALDFGDPNLPGATSFDPDETGEVVQFQRMPTATPRASLDLSLCRGRSDA